MLQEGFVLVLSCLGAIQALFLCVYLFTIKKGNQRANRFLALVLLGLTIRIGKSVFHHFTVVDPRIRNLAISAILTVGPFLWFYGRALLEKQKVFLKKEYIHLIPFTLYVFCSPIIPNKGDMLSSILYILVFVHMGIYLGISWRYLKTMNQRAAPQLIHWFRNILIGVSLIWTLFVGIMLGWIPFYILGAISFSFLMYLFSFLLLKQHVFALEKYGNSTIDRSTSQKMLQQVKQFLENDEVYLDSTISLNSMADKLGISPRELSQVINENEEKNFSEFINYYRIKKAKVILVNAAYRDEKIATIAYDCGFGNVTSFNLAFKAITGNTPSQYRNKSRRA